MSTIKITRHAYLYMAISIIAVHGLEGHAITTWVHPESGMMWLKALLSVAMPMSRIMSYGYDAKIFKGRSTLHIMDNAADILSEVQARRTSQTVIWYRLHARCLADLNSFRIVVSYS